MCMKVSVCVYISIDRHTQTNACMYVCMYVRTSVWRRGDEDEAALGDGVGRREKGRRAEPHDPMAEQVEQRVAGQGQEEAQTSPCRREILGR